MRTTPAEQLTGELVVNGRPAALEGITPHTTLLDWLRGVGLTGSKEGCAEGECGACSVMVARPAGSGNGTEWTAINACLVPVAGYAGQEIVTAEGLGSPDDLHPVQEEMAVRGGSQCGYCTPGFICSMAVEYYRPGRTPEGFEPQATQRGEGEAVLPMPMDRSIMEGAEASGASTASDHEHGPNGFDLHSLSGNLCRCTGYRPIKDAAYALGAPAAEDVFASRMDAAPPAPVSNDFVVDGARYVRPATLDEALEILASTDPKPLLIAGSTDIGVELNIRGSRPPLLVAIDRLAELRELAVGDDEIRIGAALTLTEIERALDGQVPLLGALFPQFASRLIRNGGTIGGNLGTGSPIGDSPPVLLALDARLVLTSRRGERVVPLTEYFTGYRQSVRAADELIREIRIPRPLATITAFHKIAKRRFDDISSVAVAFALDVVDGHVARAAIGLGGVAATPIRGSEAEALLVGQPWSAETVAAAAEALGRAGTPMDDHRASSTYRAAMLRQSLLKLHAENAEVGS
ncbi:MAG TPA: FAD binding domain-containing protein [Phycicoccus sp.]|nr:FAD binding domain-containing protein [Phycicoccus sp.]